MKIHNVVSKLLLYFQTFMLTPFLSPWLNMKIKSICDKKYNEKVISKGDVKALMERLGISYELDSDKLADDSIRADEFGETFDQEEPSLEEIKEAFDLFDENKDGFIDASELQRVLLCLGIKGRLVQMEECKRMIMVADEDGDERIDFNEFLKFMETCFC